MSKVAMACLSSAVLTLVGCQRCPPPPAGPTPPGVMSAGTTVTCGVNKFKLSTGTAGGGCRVDRDPQGNTTGGTCTDGKNTSTAECASNGGDGSCGSSTGAGDCTDISRKVPEQEHDTAGPGGSERID